MVAPSLKNAVGVARFAREVQLDRPMQRQSVVSIICFGMAFISCRSTTFAGRAYAKRSVADSKCLGIPPVNNFHRQMVCCGTVQLLETQELEVSSRMQSVVGKVLNWG